jgi:hypothetical protein
VALEVDALQQKLETLQKAYRALMLNDNNEMLARLRSLEDIPEGIEGDKILMAELRSTMEDIQVELKAEGDAIVAASRPLNEKRMTPSMRRLPPSAHADVDPKVQEVALEIFRHNVAEEPSVVGDVYLMGAFLISRHAHPTFETVDPDFDVGNAANNLATESSSLFRKEPIHSPKYARLDKAPKLSGQSLNTKGTIMEDVRSGNFSRAWNSNIGHYKVKTQPQMVTQNLAGSIRCVLQGRASGWLDVYGRFCSLDSVENGPRR